MPLPGRRRSALPEPLRAGLEPVPPSESPPARRAPGRSHVPDAGGPLSRAARVPGPAALPGVRPAESPRRAAAWAAAPRRAGPARVARRRRACSPTPACRRAGAQRVGARRAPATPAIGRRPRASARDVAAPLPSERPTPAGRVDPCLRAARSTQGPHSALRALTLPAQLDAAQVAVAGRAGRRHGTRRACCPTVSSSEERRRSARRWCRGPRCMRCDALHVSERALMVAEDPMLCNPWGAS